MMENLRSVYGLSMNMDCHFILSLSAASIELYHTQDGHLRCLGSTSFERDSFESEMADLAALAQGLAPQATPSGESVRCNVILPNDHIKYVTLTTSSVTESEALIAMDGATPYTVKDLEIGTRSIKGQSYIAAVAKETLEEAKGFATSHGFAPIAFLAHFDDEDEVVEFIFGEVRSNPSIPAMVTSQAPVVSGAKPVAKTKPPKRRKFPLWLISTLILILFFILLFVLSNPGTDRQGVNGTADLTSVPEAVLGNLQRDISTLSEPVNDQSHLSASNRSNEGTITSATIEAQTKQPFAPEELALQTDLLLAEFEGAKLTPAQIPWVTPVVNSPQLANHVSLQAQLSPPPAPKPLNSEEQRSSSESESAQIQLEIPEKRLTSASKSEPVEGQNSQQDTGNSALQTQLKIETLPPPIRPSSAGQEQQTQKAISTSEQPEAQSGASDNTSVASVDTTEDTSNALKAEALVQDESNIAPLEGQSDDTYQTTNEGTQNAEDTSQEQISETLLPRLAAIAPPLRSTLEQTAPENEDNSTLTSTQAPKLRPKSLVVQTASPSVVQDKAVEVADEATQNETDIESVLSSIIAAAPKDTVTVTSSAPPALRPANLRAAVSLPQKTKASVQSEQRVSRASSTTQLYNAPGRSGQNATIRKALSGNGSHLIGVYGSSKSRRALVRLSNNSYVKVSVGSDFDDGQVVSISERTMNYVKNGKTFTLTIPSG